MQINPRYIKDKTRCDDLAIMKVRSNIEAAGREEHHLNLFLLLVLALTSKQLDV